jgi:hypothetical protein
MTDPDAPMPGYNGNDVFQMTAILVSLVIIAMVGLYWFDAAKACDGMMVRSAWGWPVCIENSEPKQTD